MSASLWRSAIVPCCAGFVAAIAVWGAFAFNTNGEHEPTPRRFAQLPSASHSEEVGLPKPASGSVQPTIDHADITNVSIAAVGISVKVSGQTWPRQTRNCHSSKLCIDPPVPDQAVWYGETPSMPSTNPVLLFAHTSWSDPKYATFNNLLAVAAGDNIIVTTRTGVFTYRAEAPQLVPYDKVASSQLIYGQATEKVVLITCNRKESSGTVVTGRLVQAVSR